MSFSKRMGIERASELIQLDTMNAELKNALWNALLLANFAEFNNNPNYLFSSTTLKPIYSYLLKKPIDSIPLTQAEAIAVIRQHFYTLSWNHTYDFIEQANSLFFPNNGALESRVNFALETEHSGYRLVAGKFIPITDPFQLSEIDKATSTEESHAATHFKRALALLAEKPNPDPRNSIKESISAVESFCRTHCANDSESFSRAIAILGPKLQLHPALSEAFKKLYAYTSDESGIRHAILEEPKVTVHDAIFMLATCSAFVNYANAKLPPTQAPTRRRSQLGKRRLQGG